MIKQNSINKPADIIVSNLNYKTLQICIEANKPVLITGSSRSGKTKLAKSLKQSYPDRPFFAIPLGSSQDARLTIIGNTHAKDGNTLFDESEFVQAIKTKNAIILLEELTRSHRQVENLLGPVLDPLMGFLKLEDKLNSPKIEVAENVSFVATANEGIEYLGANIMDLSFKERFVEIQMDVLNQEEEIQIQTIKYPNIESTIIKQIAEIAYLTRLEVSKNDSVISYAISTGRVENFLFFMQYDGYTFSEACKIIIYPMYKDDELIFIKSIVEKFIL